MTREDPEAAGSPDRFATDAGAYVLGALSPADAEAFARHLPGCASCRTSVQELAALPGLLSRVPVDAVRDAVEGPSTDGRPTAAVDAAPGPVPRTLLPALLRSVRAQRRRRRWAAGVAGGLVAAHRR
ncbi:hypothetical protein GTR02_17580, partial [Kineococcus sp. R8]|uniref:zf-HC2 domain-containing protein n=1 Tax=Kineococcus siccus TaxID=2696567 RepID=UPI0014133EAD